MDLKMLKARAYDLMIQIEFMRAELLRLKEEIGRYENPRELKKEEIILEEPNS